MPLAFVHPALLAAGLAAISIPIVIHLLMRRRRKPIPWAAMRFLVEAYRKQKRRLTLEQLLLLASRCLLVALIAAAIARPILGGALAGGSRTLVLMIDNSMTAATTEDDLAALDRHKALAEDALAQLDESRGDRAAIIALGGPADLIVLEPTSDLAGVRRVLRELEATDSRADLAGAITAAAAAMTEDDDATTWLLAGHWRVGSTPVERALPSINPQHPIELLVTEPAEADPGNIAVTGIEPMRRVIVAPAVSDRTGPGPTTQVRVSLRRFGASVGQSQTSTVRLMLEGSAAPIGQSVHAWTPGQSEASVSIAIDSAALTEAADRGTGRVLVAEIDRDSLGRDNRRRRVIEVRRSLRVGLVAPGRFGALAGVGGYRPEDWIGLALAPTDRSEGLELVRLEPASLDQPRLAGLDVVILPRPDALPDGAWARIAAFVKAGGLVIITPPADTSVNLWPDALERELSLGWSIARENISLDEPASIAEGSTTAGLGGVLSMLSGELAFLTRPVRINRVLDITPSTPDGRLTTLMSLTDGRPLVVAARPGAAGARGLVLLLTVAVDPAWTDLPTKPLLVPLFQELVRQGVGYAGGDTEYTAGAGLVAPAGATELTPTGAADRARAVALGPTGSPEQPIRLAGAWLALDARGTPRGTLAINPSIQASDTATRSRAEIASWLDPIGEVTWIAAGPEAASAESAAIADVLGSDSTRPAIAWPLLIAAVLMALAELVLARRCCHVESSSAKPVGAAA